MTDWDAEAVKTRRRLDELAKAYANLSNLVAVLENRIAVLEKQQVSLMQLSPVKEPSSPEPPAPSAPKEPAPQIAGG